MELPPVGIGTAHISAEDMDAILSAAVLQANVRHIDCAKVYGNEKQVGEALEKIFMTSSGIKREDLFITSKLWNDDHLDVESACRASLDRLGLKQLDLYLIHWPLPWRKGTIMCPEYDAPIEKTWKAMEQLVDMGLTRHIGLSNFDETNLDRILKVCRIKPYANQFELHPRLSQKKLVELNQKHGIRVIAWSPLGKAKYMNDAQILKSIAEHKNRTTAQIVLRWHLQNGVAVIPRSSKTARIVSNASIHDFELSPEEMQAIDSLNQDTRLVRDWIGVFDTTPNFPYRYPIQFIVMWIFRCFFFVTRAKIDLSGNPFSK